MFEFKSEITKQFFKEKGMDIKYTEKIISFFILKLNKLPIEVKNDFMTLVEWEELFFLDNEKAKLELKLDLENNIKLASTIYSFKFYKLINIILELINKDEFFLVMPLLRSFVEHSAFLYYTFLNVQPLVKKLNSSINDYILYNGIHSQIEKYLTLSLRGVKKEILKKKIKDNIEAKSIMPVLRYVSKKNESLKHIIKHYSFLSEQTHPNLLSNEIFGAQQKTEGKEPKKFEEERLIVVEGVIKKYFRDMPQKHKKSYFSFLGSIDYSLLSAILMSDEAISGFSKLKINKVEGDCPTFKKFKSASKEDSEKIKKESKRIIKESEKMSLKENYNLIEESMKQYLKKDKKR